MQLLPAIKIGDTFSAVVTYRDATGVPINLTTAAVVPSSQVRDGNNTLVATLTVAILNQTTNPGQYTLTADTTLWPPNTQLVSDIKYVTGGTVITHSDRFGVPTISAVTA